MKSIHVAVKEIANYVYSSGDLNAVSQHHARQKIGQDLHSYWQSLYEKADQEVPVKGDVALADVTFHMTGRMDGLFKDERIIEEIKSTVLDLSQIEKDSYRNHQLQLQLYGYLYSKAHDLNEITLRLVYIHHPSKETKSFTETVSFETLEFIALTALETYKAWWTLLDAHRHDKSERFQMLPFPFASFREGQEAFIAHTFETFVREGLTYIEAPTGIGKTAASLHGALKSVKNEADKIFYVTAKNSGQDAALKALKRMQDDSAIKTVRLSSKERLCLRDEVDCDPEICPFAKGYYDRIHGALKALYQTSDDIDATLLKQIGLEHSVCPHELALDVSLLSDVIIADYNYAFDPRVRLIRFFDAQDRHPKLLIDEAHNLIERGKTMYSATLETATIRQAKTYLTTIQPSPIPVIDALLDALDVVQTHALINQEDTVLFNAVPVALIDALDPVINALETLMQRHKFHPARPHFKGLYFHLLEFKRIEEYYSDAFVFEVACAANTVSILCTDPSGPLSETLIDRAKGSVLFSATLQPVSYYQNLITHGQGYHLELLSPFDPKKLGLFVDVSHSLRYKDRPAAIPRIIDTMIALEDMGPYHTICYFPSFAYMQTVLAAGPSKSLPVWVQTPGMTPEEKEVLFNDFKRPDGTAKMLCTVLGGSFSEGVELDDNQLKGVFVIGPALPAVSPLKTLELNRFNAKYQDGFHYAFTYPGMTRVIQAVGRVIRTLDDTGIAILMDDRYQTDVYQSLMPRTWSHAKYLKEDDYIQGYLKDFIKKNDF